MFGANFAEHFGIPDLSMVQAQAAQSPLGSPLAPDYDMAAAQAAGVQPDARGHMPDTYKLPNHMTFSEESIYSGKNGAQGGQWSPLPYGEPEQHWMFTASPTNLQAHTPQQMQDYFQRQEPESILKLPDARVLGGM